MPVYVCVCVGEVCLRTFQFGQVALIKCLIYQQSSRLLHWESLFREYIFIFSNFPGIKSSRLLRLISQQIFANTYFQYMKQVTKVLSIFNAIHRVFAGSLNPPHICLTEHLLSIIFIVIFYCSADGKSWKMCMVEEEEETRVGCTYSECGSSRVYAQFPNCVIDLFEFTTERKSTWFYDVIELKSTNKASQRCFNWKYFQLSFDTCCMWWTEWLDE